MRLPCSACSGRFSSPSAARSSRAGPPEAGRPVSRSPSCGSVKSLRMTTATLGVAPALLLDDGGDSISPGPPAKGVLLAIDRVRNERVFEAEGHL